MKYLNVLGLLIVLAFSSTILAQVNQTEKPKGAEKLQESPTKTIPFFGGHPTPRRQKPLMPYIPADVTDVELTFDEVKRDLLNSELCFIENISGIEVVTKSTNPNNDTLIYNYVVSGGKIIGKGEKVIWDLSGVKAGTYTIRAAVDDGCGFCGSSITKTVTVK